MKTYKVIGEKVVDQATNAESFLDVVDKNGAIWNPGANVTDQQFPDELANELISKGILELVNDDTKA